VTPCSLLGRHQRPGETGCLYIVDLLFTDEAGSMFLRNFDINVTDFLYVPLLKVVKHHDNHVNTLTGSRTTDEFGMRISKREEKCYKTRPLFRM
jgi:hypothetical protein